MLHKTFEVLKQFQAHQGSVVQVRSGGKIQKRSGKVQIKTQSYPVSATLKLEYQSKLNPINKRLEELGIKADLDAVEEAGGKFKDFGLVDNVFDQGKTHLAHNPGEVLLVDVWATWCGPCQRPMKHNQEMLQKNQGVWGNRVRIIGVSVDVQKQVIKERVISKKWERVVHLTLLGWQHEHPLIKQFKIAGIPFVCLVDKWGNINYVGHPSTINLEDRINDLLNQTVDTSSNTAATAKAADSSAIQKVLHFLNKETIQKEFKDSELAFFKYNKIQKLEKGISYTTLQINAYIADGDAVSEEIIRKIYGNHPGVDLKIQRVKITKIPQVEHPDCSLCNAKGLNYPFYWLKWEEGVKFGCRACVEKKAAVEGHHYAYEKNSILLLGKWQKVSEKDLGNNLQPADIAVVQDPHQYDCNGCGEGSESVGEARYISLGCRSYPISQGGWVDLCEKCIQAVINKDENVLNKLKPEGHDPNHPFLRILYNTKGYQQF